jgi:hypothetical protein
MQICGVDLKHRPCLQEKWEDEGLHRFQRFEQGHSYGWIPMPIADLLVDAAAGHEVISFMDGNAGYSQIFTAIEDISETAFRCPGHIGLFEWIVMTFGLKNAGATYQ